MIEAPETVNSSPYDAAWLIKIRLDDPSLVDSLMSISEYDDFAAAGRS